MPTPDHAPSAAWSRRWDFLTVWHRGFYCGAIWMGSLLGLVWLVTRK